MSCKTAKINKRQFFGSLSAFPIGKTNGFLGKLPGMRDSLISHKRFSINLTQLGLDEPE
jgi:hypothetical protein